MKDDEITLDRKEKETNLKSLTLNVFVETCIEEEIAIIQKKISY